MAMESYSTENDNGGNDEEEYVVLTSLRTSLRGIFMHTERSVTRKQIF